MPVWTSVRRLLTALALTTLMSPAPLLATDHEEWRFNVLLDGSPIGTQTFRRQRDGDESKVTIEATLDVKILFMTAYSYRHRDEEVWTGECLKSMNSTTDDNGSFFRVRASATAEGLLVETGQGRRTLDGCVDSFAYWDPNGLKSSHLLNSQTGEYEAVNLLELGEESVFFRGESVLARRLVISGEKIRIDLWYTAGNDWVALESTTKSGRKLYYQRQ